MSRQFRDIVLRQILTELIILSHRNLDVEIDFEKCRYLLDCLYVDPVLVLFLFAEIPSYYVQEYSLQFREIFFAFLIRFSFWN